MRPRESTQSNDNENYRVLSFYIVCKLRWPSSMPAPGCTSKASHLVQSMANPNSPRIVSQNTSGNPSSCCVDILTFTASQINNKVWLAGWLFHYNRFNWIKSFTCNIYIQFHFRIVKPAAHFARLQYSFSVDPKPSSLENHVQIMVVMCRSCEL